jgi:hypothetical protein
MFGLLLRVWVSELRRFGSVFRSEGLGFRGWGIGFTWATWRVGGQGFRVDPV